MLRLSLRRKLLIPILIASLAGIYFTSRFASSNIVAFVPEIAMERWVCMGEIESLDEWGGQYKLLDLALLLSPYNSGLFNLAAQFHEFKALSYSAWSDDAKLNRIKAIALFEQAIKHRPFWSMTKVNYARSLVMHQILDEKVFSSIRGAIEMGRWQVETRQAIVHLSVPLWSETPRDIKTYVRTIVKHELTRNENVISLIYMAFKFDWVEELKRLTKDRKILEMIASFENDESLLAKIIEKQTQEKVC